MEVWGTMENNRLLVMDKYHGTWHHNEIEIKLKDPKIRLCSQVAFTRFINDQRVECEHVWVSYEQQSVLVSLDARKREQRCILNCADMLKESESIILVLSLLPRVCMCSKSTLQY